MRKKTAAKAPRTYRFDASVPMQKVSQHMQNTIAQHQQRREKVTWKPSRCIARAEREWFHAKAATPATVAHASQLSLQRNLRPTEKNAMFRANPNIIQIASMM